MFLHFRFRTAEVCNATTSNKFLFPYQMVRIHVELIADVFMDFPVREQGVRAIKSVGLGEGLGIFERDLHLKVT